MGDSEVLQELGRDPPEIPPPSSSHATSGVVNSDAETARHGRLRLAQSQSTTWLRMTDPLTEVSSGGREPIAAEKMDWAPPTGSHGKPPQER